VEFCKYFQSKRAPGLAAWEFEVAVFSIFLCESSGSSSKPSCSLAIAWRKYARAGDVSTCGCSAGRALEAPLKLGDRMETSETVLCDLLNVMWMWRLSCAHPQVWLGNVPKKTCFRLPCCSSQNGDGRCWLARENPCCVQCIDLCQT